MAESITITSTFGRKKSMGNYNMAEASIVVSQTFAGDVSPEEIERVAAEQFIHTKSRVFLELGLEFSQDEETMLIAEVFTPTVEVVAAPARRELPAPPQRTGGYGGGRPAPRQDKDSLWRDLMDNPDGWERVQSDNPKAPDFRSRTILQPGTQFKVGLWLKDAPDWFQNQLGD